MIILFLNQFEIHFLFETLKSQPVSPFLSRKTNLDLPASPHHPFQQGFKPRFTNPSLNCLPSLKSFLFLPHPVCRQSKKAICPDKPSHHKKHTH